MIPDWLLPTIKLFPAVLWIFLGIGLPWSLAILPRDEWRFRVTVIAVAIALGPLALTIALFLLGTFGTFTAVGALIASFIAAAIGAIFAWRQFQRPIGAPHIEPVQSLTALEITLIFVIGVAVVIRFWNTAYWPYTTYDEFWAYGYDAKIFMLRGNIPGNLGYYPILIPLTYTFQQLMWGGINEHAARTVVPVFALGSVLMAYVLGARLFNRRIGLLTAAIWVLYPQHAAWSQFGDLEVPITLYFTATAAFFILGWRERRWRYLFLSGILLAAALWTKPTSAALIESLLLIGGASVVFQVWKRRTSYSIAIGRLQIPGAAFALLVAAPIGGIWYIRNLLLGLEPIVLPAGYWQTEAQRSGQELGWLLLIAVAGVALIVRRNPQIQRIAAAIGGLTLFAIVSLYSAFGGRLLTFDEWRQLIVGGIPITVKPTSLTILEYALIIVGIALIVWAAIPLWRKLSDAYRGTILLIGAFIGPYFVTWFWSYSYHYRLSFAIVPLLCVLLAALLDTLIGQPRRFKVMPLCIIVVALALPGWFAAMSGLEPAITGSVSNDHDKIAQGNVALMRLVDFLTEQRAKLNRPLKVEAPGELRLPYFFPDDDIRAGGYPIHNGDYPTLLDQIKGIDFFIDSSAGDRLYAENGKLDHNQILASLTRDNVMKRVYFTDDGNFRFWVYTLDDQSRFIPPKPNGPINVQVGDFATLAGYDLSTSQGIPESSIYLTFWWQAIKAANRDYSVEISLWDSTQDKEIYIWPREQPVFGAFSVWNKVPGVHPNIAYPTRVWEAGETVKDEWRLVVPTIPPGKYDLRVGLYDSVANARLPISKDGQDLGDNAKLYPFTILPK